FICDYAYRSLLQMPSLGKNPEERAKMVKRGGLTIQTSIDPKVQDAAQNAVSNVVGPKDPVLAGTAIVQPGTGLLMAMAQSRPSWATSPGKPTTTTWHRPQWAEPLVSRQGRLSRPSRGCGHCQGHTHEQALHRILSHG
ncbi:hypothetical protein AB5N37_22870, partial [Xanthomonas citri pv. citri]